MLPSFSFQRTFSVARKELLHIFRDPQTLFFTLVIPIIELFMLGYAIDTNVRHIRTVYVDHAGTQESRRLLEQFENSQDVLLVRRAYSQQEASEAIVAGEARIGIIIPMNYSERLQAGETAQVLVLVDGTESSIAAEAVNVSNAITLRESLIRVLGDRQQLPIEARPRILFNPDTRSANFFIPGLMVVMCQMMATMLSANAIVREKQNGTLEQLFMTPVRRGELIIGKMVPYVVLTNLEFCMIAFLMRIFFFVPIRGAFITLLLITFPFVLTMLGAGLWISTRASTVDAAGQLAMGTFLPSVFLSGYVFPLDSMPWILRQVSVCIPATWLIDASRSVILRGGGWRELWQHAVVLWCMAIGMLVFSSLRLKKKLG
jgi:ABC-2 type transport system permease protein